MQHDNTPYTRLTPLLPEKWQEGSGPAKGSYYYQGPYDVTVEPDGRWRAAKGSDQVSDLHATKEAAMEACAKDRCWCILRAESLATAKLEQRKQMQA